MPAHRRGPWSQAEDTCLLQLVHSQGAHNWVRISNLIGSRTPKQCRERYHQNLKPSLNHEPITPEEGLLIEKLVGEMGKRWAEIARRLQGRSDNAVKNWWNGGMNRRRRLCIRRGDTSRCGAAFDERTEQLSFARPVDSYEHSLVTTTISPPRRNFDTPLPSPSMASETSRTDSADGAPSLVSDTASSFSVSPRIQELPPLTNNYQDGRRPSLPIFHVGANMFVSDSESQTPTSFTHRLDMEQQRRKDYEPPMTPQRYDHRALPIAFEAVSPPASLEYHHLRGQIKSDSPPSPPRENLLPPLRLLGCSSDRDTRMTLSSILD
jgi:Myb-like DNA-binding protein FlbD